MFGTSQLIIVDENCVYITDTGGGMSSPSYRFNQAKLSYSPYTTYPFTNLKSVSKFGTSNMLIIVDENYVYMTDIFGGMSSPSYRFNQAKLNNSPYNTYPFKDLKSAVSYGSSNLIIGDKIYYCGYWRIQLYQITETTGTKTSRTRYSYDSYGNVTKVYVDGDTSITTDDSTIDRAFFPNVTANILSKLGYEQISGGGSQKLTYYYYDNNTNYNTPPTKGNLTRIEQRKEGSYSINTYHSYFTNGNLQTTTDPNGNQTGFTYESTFNTYPAVKTVPIIGSENYTYEWNWSEGSDTGIVKITVTDVNGNATVTYYDTFNRVWKIVKTGDSFDSPSIEYQYLNWGTLNSQCIKTITKVDDNTFLWQCQYFDGVGRVVQVQSNGEDGYTIISSTTAFNNRGMVEKQYVSQDIASVLTSYQTPEAGWKYSSTAYDALGRVISQTAADGTTMSHDYSSPWQDTVTNPNGYKTRYSYDAFGRLVKVEELDAGFAVYATTTYAYDVLGNLVDVWDNANNNTHMTYNRLSQKITMNDPDMRNWTYSYDNNGNLVTQTDAKNKAITMTYDALNRLTLKSYPTGSGMTNVVYTYDQGINGKGQRTAMTDASGITNYRYDVFGRLIEEKRTIDSTDYITSYTYDGAGRILTTTYPSGEVVTQTYNGQGLPYSLSGSNAGDLVFNTLYNNLGAITEKNLVNRLTTTNGNYATGGGDLATGGYYGKLWK